MRGVPARPAIDRFMEKVEPELNTGCWLWAASANRKGYGQFMAQKGDRPELSHRFSWRFYRGPIPVADDGRSLCVLHRCDTPACVNPAHLFLGTRAENNRDMTRKGRHNARNFAKLSPGDVTAIRQRRARGEICRTIAADFGVCRETVGHIVRGHTWKRAA